MNITIAIAQVLGITLTVFGLALIFKRKSISDLIEEIVRNKPMLLLGGFIATVIGALIIVLNNIWSSGLELFITVIGWGSLLKGILILFFPNKTISLYKKCNKSNLLLMSGIISLVIGLILMYQG